MNDTIALVDDDRNILTSVSMALEAEGYKVQNPVGVGSSAILREPFLGPWSPEYRISVPSVDESSVCREGLEFRDVNKEVHEYLVGSRDTRRKGAFNTQVRRNVPAGVVLREAPRPSGVGHGEPPVFPDVVEGMDTGIMLRHAGSSRRRTAERMASLCIHRMGTLDPRGCERRSIAEATLGASRKDREI